ncbi:MAG: hypothetical protein ACFB10_10775 [Salibacteraceae bacterium]
MLHSIGRKVVYLSLELGVALLQFLGPQKRLDNQLKALAHYPKGTLGYDLSQWLRQRNNRLVPGFESHDLKHLLLGYDTSPEDEVRMQAFLLGNGNVTGPTLFLFLYGSFWMPRLWKHFPKDFRRGQHTQPMQHYSLAQHAHLNTLLMKQNIDTPIAPAHHNNTPRFWARISMLAGTFGMLFCFPFLWSSNLADLVGAGFPFLAGAVLFGAGVLSLNRNPSQGSPSIAASR